MTGQRPSGIRTEGIASYESELPRRTRVLKAFLAYEPGHGWGYSNVGYLIVRNLIENETGVPLGPALERLVFGPLNISGVAVAKVSADLDVTAWGNRCRFHPEWVHHGLLIGPPSAAALFLHHCLPVTSCFLICWPRCTTAIRLEARYLDALG